MKPFTEEDREKVWKSQPREARKLILEQSMFHLLIDNSLETAIQMAIDTFGCDHSEVITALKGMTK